MVIRSEDFLRSAIFSELGINPSYPADKVRTEIDIKCISRMTI